MIIGSRAWQQFWSGPMPGLHKESCARYPAEWEEDSICTCGSWQRKIRDRARSYHDRPDTYRMATWHQQSSLSEEMVDRLEVAWALQRLRDTDKRLYSTVMRVDVHRPFEPLVGEVPKECRRGYQMERAARHFGVSVSTINNWLNRAYAIMEKSILDGPVRERLEKDGRIR